MQPQLDTGSATTAPRPAHRLDEGALLSFLQRSVPNLASAPGPLLVRQFQHGQSNPTYLLQLGDARLVLRKQPPGRLLASAHAVDREHRVLSALAHTPVPVPRPLALCTGACNAAGSTNLPCAHKQATCGTWERGAHHC